MRMLCLRCAFALMVGLSMSAAAQREAVKNTAGDASATKADPPKHAKTGKTGKTGKNASAAEPTDASAAPEGKNDTPGGGAEKKEQLAYAFGLPTPDGKNLPLSEYKGKVLLIVNLARASGYASQLPALQTLSASFKDKGLVVIGVPSNDFGNAEPGTKAEVAKFYADAKVDFPVMELSSLTGVHQLPLFTYLAKNKAIHDDSLSWNFTKFLVDRKGKVIARFAPEVAPDSLQMMATVEEALDGTWKPKKQPSKDSGEDAGDDDDD